MCIQDPLLKLLHINKDTLAMTVVGKQLNVFVCFLNTVRFLDTKMTNILDTKRAPLILPFLPTSFGMDDVCIPHGEKEGTDP